MASGSEEKKGYGADVPLPVLWSCGRPRFKDGGRFVKGSLVLLHSAFSPLSSLVLRKLLKELLVDRAAQCSLFFCRNISRFDTLREDGVDEASVVGPPQIIWRFHPRPLEAVSGEFCHENSHRVVGPHFQTSTCRSSLCCRHTAVDV